MEAKAQLRQEAYQEYLKEKDQVDKVISKMIDEDQKMIALIKMKQEQSKLDMIQSVNEKRELVRKQKEMEEFERIKNVSLKAIKDNLENISIIKSWK